MEVKLSSKKTKILILIIFFIVLAGAGGYLLWRVNQPETLSPGYSEAAPKSNEGPIATLPCDGILVDLEHATHLCNPSYRYGQWVCGTNCMSDARCNDDPDHDFLKSDACPDTREFTVSHDNIVEGIYTIIGLIGRGHLDQDQRHENFRIIVQNGRTDDRPNISTYDSTKENILKYETDDEGNRTYWEGFDNLGTFYLSEGSNTVTMEHQFDCTGLPKTAESVHLYKLCLKEVNICEKGRWKNDPSGTHEYGTLGKSIAVEVLDKDGLGEAEVTLNGSNLPKCSTELRGGLTRSTVGVSCYYTETTSSPDEIIVLIDPGQQNIAPGKYSLGVSWEDGKGIGGSNCELSTTFTVLEEVKNPDWDITKIPAESCIDENTTNPTAKLEYVITIENKGEGTGQIISIVDTLDSKVQQDYIENIGSGGQFSNGKITWTLTGTERDFASGQSKTYAYSYIVPKDAFGLYENTVEATPAEGDTLIANTNATGDCLILEEESDPICDGGAWNTAGKPSGVYPYCSEIDLSFDAWDSDGVDKDSIAVEVNRDILASISKTTVETGDKRVRVEDTLSTETSCLEPGDYNIDAEWADKEGATGSQCTLTTSFTVLEEVKNPDWDIAKIPVESCIGENTENPKAKLEYVITIENKGEGTGQIISIVDTLDSKVKEDYIDNIGSGGEFSNGEITWTLSGTERDFAPGESKTYSYSYIVPKDAFGLYANTVEATPAEGNTLIANTNVTGDCLILEEEPVVPEEDLPGTGIFDDGQRSLIAGFLLLLLGFTWRFIGRGVILFFNGAFGFGKEVIKKRNMKQSLDRKKNFEKKVVKD